MFTGFIHSQNPSTTDWKFEKLFLLDILPLSRRKKSLIAASKQYYRCLKLFPNFYLAPSSKKKNVIRLKTGFFFDIIIVIIVYNVFFTMFTLNVFYYFRDFVGVIMFEILLFSQNAVWDFSTHPFVDIKSNRPSNEVYKYVRRVLTQTKYYRHPCVVNTKSSNFHPSRQTACFKETE